MKILAVQHPHGKPPPLKTFRRRDFRDIDFICFPEYFMSGPDRSEARKFAATSFRAHRYLRALSKISSAIAIGTFIEGREGKLHNSAYLYARGQKIGRYNKINPTVLERIAGIQKGKGLKTFSHRGVRFSILICNDILKGIRPFPQEPKFNPGIFRKLRGKRVEVIFVPLISPFRQTDTPRKILERRATLARMAKIANATIVKVGGVGQLFGEPVRGRSVIFDHRGKQLAIARSDRRNELLLVQVR